MLACHNSQRRWVLTADILDIYKEQGKQKYSSVDIFVASQISIKVELRRTVQVRWMWRARARVTNMQKLILEWIIICDIALY